MNQKPIFDRRSLFYSFWTLALFFALAAIIIKSTKGSFNKGAPAWIPQKERYLANKLKGVGLLEQSARAYERYLQRADISPREWSRIAYTIGQTYMEAKKYEQALTWFYQVELADPGTSLATEAGPLIITCLERLGRHQAAEYALKARTSLDPNDKMTEEDKGGKIVARIGKDTIYLNQIDKALEGLPDWMKKEFSDPVKKRDFAKQYIAEELIYRKGVKLGYADDPRIREDVERITRQLVISQVSKTEIEDKIDIDDEDVKNYFIAHKDEYKDPTQDAPPEYEKVKDMVKEDYRRAKIRQGYQELILHSLSSADVSLYLENVN